MTPAEVIDAFIKGHKVEEPALREAVSRLYFAYSVAHRRFVRAIKAIRMMRSAIGDHARKETGRPVRDERDAWWSMGVVRVYDRVLGAINHAENWMVKNTKDIQ